MGLLEKVADFKGLGKLSQQDLTLLCSELRQKILSVTLKNGGHLSSSLGSVELTVALLRAFNPDEDKIIFDVGHQSYSYKILTDRLETFGTLRKKGGIAGFPRMDESRYDFFTTGHSSTSISAAMGYAKARDLCGEKFNVIAVIGDGALLNGVAFEALNGVDNVKSKIIIVLNDNKMSINPRVGGMANHLARLSVNPVYKKFKDFIKEQCRAREHGGEKLEEALGNIKTKLKSLLLPTNVFEAMDISYWGPFDGHNVREMESVFNLAKNYDRSLLIHVITQKGKGFPQTEAHPSYFHGVGPGTSLDAADMPSKSSSAPSWSSVMAGSLEALAAADKRVVVCTAAMKDGTKLGSFAKKYPDRFFDAGISEEHLLIFAAGMAAAGMRPAVCIYSTFLQRTADQIVHDICLPKLPVLLGIDRAGFVGEDGETHHGLLDVSWLRAIPNMTIAAPRDAVDLDFFVRGWLKRSIPMAIRYPRGTAVIPVQPREPAPWGKLEVLETGRTVCLLGVGSTTPLMLKTAAELKTQNIVPTVVDLRFIKPFDKDALTELLSRHTLMITAEENELCGGVGEAIVKIACDCGSACKVISLGAPDEFVAHATRAEQWQECGMTVDNIIRICTENVSQA
jgi:1-deoxy-D-xylulose-5-phosphate synthase